MKEKKDKKERNEREGMKGKREDGKTRKERTERKVRTERNESNDGPHRFLHTSTFEGRFDLLSAKGTEICFSPSPTPKHILPPACSYVSPASPTVVMLLRNCGFTFCCIPVGCTRNSKFQIFMPISFGGKIGDFGNQTLHTIEKTALPHRTI